ncbi:hypothetical protein [Escherichia phage M01]|nr:hypothetical protein [Escherichia phage M01]
MAELCSASLACEKDIPNTSGKAAVLGTAMHTIAEVHLNALYHAVLRCR